MKTPIIFLTFVFLFVFALTSHAQGSRQVVINGVTLDAGTLSQLEAAYQTPIADGKYWYDSKTGAWGKQGGPTAGWIHPNLQLGGPLSASASGNSGTGVYINGRQLHATDVANLNKLFAAYGTQTMPGRYWTDASGNFGLEGQGYPLGNLMQMAQGLSGGGKGSYYKTNGSDYTGFSSGGYTHKRTYGPNRGTTSVFTDGGSVEIYNQPQEY